MTLISHAYSYFFSILKHLGMFGIVDRVLKNVKCLYTVLFLKVYYIYGFVPNVIDILCSME